jgi:vacuolar-type H+-ATPase subunit I/STV1
MKKIGLMVVAVSLALSLTAFAAEKPAKPQTPPQRTQIPLDAKGRPRLRASDANGLYERQIAAIKQEQKARIDELQEIKKLAAEEKATKTVAALDKLIAQHNQQYQKRIEAVQQRMEKVQAARKSATEAPKATKTAPKKGNN